MGKGSLPVRRLFVQVLRNTRVVEEIARGLSPGIS